MQKNEAKNEFFLDGTDITSMALEHRKVAEFEKELNELLTTANSIIIRLNPDGSIKFVNEFGLRYFGYDWQEMKNNHLLILFPVEES